MPHFHAFDLIKWLHLITFAVGGGGAVIALMLAGLEEAQPEYRGLAAALWKKVVAWSFRLAVVLGIVLLVMQFQQGLKPFAQVYLHLKLTFVVLMLGVSETTPRSLAKGKRGAALLVLILFLLTTFVVMTKRSFGGRQIVDLPHSNVTAPALQAH